MRAGRDPHVLFRNIRFSVMSDRRLKLTNCACGALHWANLAKLKFVSRKPLLWTGQEWCAWGLEAVVIIVSCPCVWGQFWLVLTPVHVQLSLTTDLAVQWSSGSWLVPGSAPTSGCTCAASLRTLPNAHSLCSPFLGAGGARVSDLLTGDFSDSPFQTLTSQFLPQLSKVWLLRWIPYPKTQGELSFPDGTQTDTDIIYYRCVIAILSLPHCL